MQCGKKCWELQLLLLLQFMQARLPTKCSFLHRKYHDHGSSKRRRATIKEKRLLLDSMELTITHPNFTVRLKYFDIHVQTGTFKKWYSQWQHISFPDKLLSVLFFIIGFGHVLVTSRNSNAIRQVMVTCTSSSLASDVAHLPMTSSYVTCVKESPLWK